MRYYIDTCIYLNIWQKEDGKRGEPWWQYGHDLIDMIESSDNEGIYSGAILKEMKFILEQSMFVDKKHFLERLNHFHRIDIEEIDIEHAKKLMQKFSSLSLFDCLHIVLCLRANATLVTRDKNLAKYGRQFIAVSTPEFILYGV